MTFALSSVLSFFKYGQAGVAWPGPAAPPYAGHAHQGAGTKETRRYVDGKGIPSM